MPYAILAGLGLGLSLRAVGSSPKRESLPKSLEKPAGVSMASPENAPSAAPDEEANAEAIRLISAYKPAGSNQSVAEILAPELDASSAASPWVFERLEGNKVAVTLRPYGETMDNLPVYEFEVDLDARSVKASAETEQGLRGADLADARSQN